MSGHSHWSDVKKLKHELKRTHPEKARAVLTRSYCSKCDRLGLLDSSTYECVGYTQVRNDTIVMRQQKCQEISERNNYMRNHK